MLSLRELQQVRQAKVIRLPQPISGNYLITLVIAKPARCMVDRLRKRILTRIIILCMGKCLSCLMII